VLVGPSGAGKSTVLKMINRLVPPSSGTVRVAGEDAARLRPEVLRRRMGYVIQSIGLFPHWTVERNIGAVPALLGWPRAKIRERVSELLELLQLEPGRFRAMYPHQLSGGQQQRVGVARALAGDPAVLLMDEPFGALDPITRDALQEELARLHRRNAKTIVFVTHDMEEALRLASRVAILDRGRLVQVGTPREVLSSPANDFVRDFVGRKDLGLRLLAVETVASRLRAGETAPGAPIAAAASLREALSEMIVRGADRLAVAGPDGRPAGAVHLADLTRR
jgi:osmoprotectant transport system ATP-binding protein